MKVRLGMIGAATAVCLMMLAGFLGADEKPEKKLRKKQFNPVFQLRAILTGGKAKQAAPTATTNSTKTSSEVKRGVVCCEDGVCAVGKCCADLFVIGGKSETQTAQCAASKCAASKCAGAKCTAASCAAGKCSAASCAAGGKAAPVFEAAKVQCAPCDGKNCPGAVETFTFQGVIENKERSAETGLAPPNCKTCPLPAVVRASPPKNALVVSRWVAVDGSAKCESCTCCGGGKCKCGDQCGDKNVCKKDCACRVKTTVALTTSLSDKAVHLLKAAKHLEAAGLVEQAQQIRQQAETEGRVQELLRKKQQQVALLQQEISKLQKLAPSPQQVLVKMQVLQADLNKLRKLGLDYSHLTVPAKKAGKKNGIKSDQTQVDLVLPNPQKGVGSVVADPDGAVLAWVKTMQKNKLLQTISRPQVITLNGHPAVISIGGEFVAAKNQTPRFNSRVATVLQTHVEIVPTVVDGQRVRLRVKPKIAHVTAAYTTKTSKKTSKKTGKKSGVKTSKSSGGDLEIETNVVFNGEATADVKKGQTMILWGTPQKPSTEHAVGVVILATPQVIESESTDATPPKAVSAQKVQTKTKSAKR